MVGTVLRGEFPDRRVGGEGVIDGGVARIKGAAPSGPQIRCVTSGAAGPEGAQCARRQVTEPVRDPRGEAANTGPRRDPPQSACRKSASAPGHLASGGRSLR